MGIDTLFEQWKNLLNSEKDDSSEFYSPIKPTSYLDELFATPSETSKTRAKKVAKKSKEDEQSLVPQQTTPEQFQSKINSLGGNADSKGRFKEGDHKAFVTTMYPIVKSYLDKIGKGNFATVVLAQMATESAWGNKISGEFNYSGMMATKSEKGTMCNTFEYINGKKVNTRSKFKDFKNIDDFMSFYVDRLNNKFKAFVGPDYAANIRARGYYTAPLDKYRDTLQSVEKQVKSYLT